MVRTIESRDGAGINVLIEGKEGAPVILFAHSVGCDLHLWDAQARLLGGRHRVVRYDARGHGRSEVLPGPYRVEDLAADALAVMDAFGIGAAHFCGLSLGGTTGQWLALHAPERLLTLTLADTAARLGTVEGWQSRIDAVLASGTGSIAAMSMTRFFSEEFRKSSPDVVERFRRSLADTDDEGFAGCCAVLRDCDFREQLSAIQTPTLVICGAQDIPTPPADSEALARGIREASLRVIEAGHLSAVENPGAFAEALEHHVRQHRT